MANKRKRAAASPPTRKRQRAQSHPHGVVDEDREYKIKSIIGETATRYHISWEDDEVTGEHFEDTWEPKNHANQLAIADWERQKAERRASARVNGGVVSNGTRRAPAVSAEGTTTPPTKKKGRPRKVILSSSPPPEIIERERTVPITSAPEAVPEIGESPHSQIAATSAGANEESPLFVPDDSPEPSSPHDRAFAVVQNPEPPSSYLAGAYEAFSISQSFLDNTASSGKVLPEPSQYLPDPADTTGTTEGTTGISLAPTTPSEPPQSVPVEFGGSSLKIVPDSQTPNGSSSFVPSAVELESAPASAPEAQTNGVGQQLPGSSSQVLDSRGSASDPASSTPVTDEESEGVAFAGATADQHHPVSGIEEHVQTTNGTQESVANFEQAQRLHTEQSTNLGREGYISNGTQSPVPDNSYQNDWCYTSSPHASDQRSAEEENFDGAQPLSADNEEVAPRSDHIPEGQQELQSSGNGIEQSYIDLVSAEQPTLGSPFTVTPPPRTALNYDYQGTTRPPLQSSAWLPEPSPSKTQSPAEDTTGKESVPSLNSQHYSEGPKSQPLLLGQSNLGELSTITPRAASAPYQHLSPIETLSSIAAPPVDSIEIVPVNAAAQYSAPAPSTPNRVRTMDTTQSTPGSGQSLREKLDAMNARFRPASRDTPTSAPKEPPVSEPDAQPQQSPAVKSVLDATPLNPARLASPALIGRSARSPSAIPAEAPLPIITQEEMNTSERYETLLPQAQDTDSSERTKNGSMTMAGSPPQDGHVPEDLEKASMYTIPIALFGHQRDQYPSVVYFHRETIREFLTASRPNDDLIQRAKQFIKRARNVAMHPDLDNTETFTQQDVEPSQQAEWDVKCSAKFRFLQDLINRLRSRSLHIAILSSPGRIVSLLNTFLQGLGFDSPGSMADGSGPSDFGGKLGVTLWSTDDEPSSLSPANVVIAMDNAARHDSPTVRALRQFHGKWSPFITLVVPYTVEHVERCLSPHLSDRAQARALVNGIYQLRTEAGKLEEGQLSVKDAADALAQYLISEDGGKKWPLEALSMLEDLDSQTESEIELPTENGVDAPTPAKRSRDVDESGDEAESGKRARLSSPKEEDDTEPSHVDDSVEEPSVNALGRPAVVVRAASTSTERRLQQLLDNAQHRLTEHQEALADLQYRHEEQRNKLVEVTTERDDAIATAQQAVTRLGEQSSLRPRMKELEQQLKEANERLVNHSVPERAEFETLKLAAAQAMADREKLEKRLEQSAKDLAYIRELYQNSSNIAQSLGSQTTDLETRLAVAENKATGEQTKLREMGYDAYTKNLEKENKKIKALLKDREAGIRFRDDEIAKLKEASRGRMGTRGTSVPRSPRLGSPMKRAGSRQGSPSAGDVRGRGSLLHPLRNA